jgi:hypothetical protein
MEKKRPTLSYLRTWGCLAKVNSPINNKRKIGPKTVDYILLGYASYSIAYRFIVVKSGVDDMNVGPIFESRYVTFFENIFPLRGIPRMSSGNPIQFVNLKHLCSLVKNLMMGVQTLMKMTMSLPQGARDKGLKILCGIDFIVYLTDETPSTMHFRSSCIFRYRLLELEGTRSKQDLSWLMERGS